MSAREFQEWQEYYKIEPFGDDWKQASLITASNLAPWSKRKIDPEKFIPKAKVRKTPQQIEAQMTQWALAHNRECERRNRGKS